MWLKKKQEKTKEVMDSSSGAAVVGGAHAFVLMMCRAVGLAPVTFTRLPPPGHKCPARWTLHLSRLYCFVSCLVLTLMVCLSVFGLVRELRTPAELSVRLRSMTARVVGSGDVLAVLTTSAVGIYGAPKRAVRLLRVLGLLSQVDNSLGIQLMHTKERKLCLIIIAVLISWTCLLVDDFVLYANRAKMTNSQYQLLQNYMGFYLLYYVVIMLEVQFAFMAYSIFLRLRRLNEVLATTGRNLSLVKGIAPKSPFNVRNVIRFDTNQQASNEKPDNMNSNGNEVYTIKIRPADIGPKKLGNLVDALGLVADENKLTSQDPSESIRKLSDLHGVLCAAAREVDASFGLPVLIILISTLLHLIVTPYFLILELGGLHRPHYLVLQFLWCSAHALRLLMLVEPCHRTKNEASRTGDIVGEMLGHWQASGTVLRRLELFSRQLLHRTPDFTALGVCSLDRPLIASVTAAVTTYLVILIQFQKQDDMDKEKS